MQFENHSQKFFYKQTLENLNFWVLGQIFRAIRVYTLKEMDLRLNPRPIWQLENLLPKYIPILEIALAGE